MTDKTKDSPKAILFDMDGVLVNNHDYHVKAWEAYGEKHGRFLSKEEFDEHVNGQTTKSVIRYMYDNNISEEKVQQLSDEKEELYRALYKPHMAPVAGLLKLLDQLKSSGWLLAVATSAPTENLRYTVDGLEISHYFDAFVDSSGADIKNGKPAPDIYLKAAKVLNVPPGRCIVFEDSMAGITAGQRAGMQVVALTTTHTAEELAQTEVRWIHSSFETINNNLLNNILDEAH
ncbi:HAD family phosphatase [Cesiribacter sp. SM1]|uniref:HAD family hydrolase n=1 Tax=Cesiribacter sp. SM1 TaxID=2861196 RepID=UPI001CD62C21|nr:HAD family phosphatase [Cesiribacter sp. SM1]